MLGSFACDLCTGYSSLRNWAWQGRPRGEMTVEERIEAADRRKVDGNELFKEGKIAAAMQQYEMVDLLFFRFYLDPAKVSHIQVLVSYFFPTPCIKLKLGLQICGRQLIVSHLDQSNYLANQKQGAVNKYNFTVFMRHFQGSSRPLEDVHFSSGPTGYDCCTSSKVSSAGPHSEHWWSCS